MYGEETFSALIVVYDFDTTDQLTLSNVTSSNGTLSLTVIDSQKRDDYFDCNVTWVSLHLYNEPVHEISNNLTV